MKFKTGDKVIITAGKNKGNISKIIKVIKKDNKVIVEGQNLVKKHIKPSANNQTGGIVTVEAPINAPNVMFVDDKNKRSRKRIESKKEETKKIVKKSPKKATK